MKYDEWGEPIAGTEQPSALSAALKDFGKDYMEKFQLRLGLRPGGKKLTKEQAKYVKNYRETAGKAAEFKRKMEEARLKQIATIGSAMKPAIQSPNFGYNFAAPQFGGR